MIRPVFDSGRITCQIVAAGRLHPRLRAASTSVLVDVRHRDRLQDHDQRQRQRHVPDQRAEVRVQHRVRPKPDIAEHRIDHAALRQDHEP